MKTLVIFTRRSNVGPSANTKLAVFGISSTQYWDCKPSGLNTSMILVVEENNEYIAYDCTIVGFKTNSTKHEGRCEIDFTWKSETVKLKGNFRDTFGQHPSQWHNIDKADIFCTKEA